VPRRSSPASRSRPRDPGDRDPHRQPGVVEARRGRARRVRAGASRPSPTTRSSPPSASSPPATASSSSRPRPPASPACCRTRGGGVLRRQHRRHHGDRSRAQGHRHRARGLRRRRRHRRRRRRRRGCGCGRVSDRWRLVDWSGPGQRSPPPRPTSVPGFDCARPGARPCATSCRRGVAVGPGGRGDRRRRGRRPARRVAPRRALHQRAALRSAVGALGLPGLCG
jgi:hypothetical protein